MRMLLARGLSWMEKLLAAEAAVAPPTLNAATRSNEAVSLFIARVLCLCDKARGTEPRTVSLVYELIEKNQALGKVNFGGSIPAIYRLN